MSVSPLKKVKREAAAQRRPAPATNGAASLMPCSGPILPEE